MPRVRAVVRVAVMLALLGAIVSAIVLLPVRESLERFLGWVEGTGIWGPVVLAGFYIVATVLFLPGSLLTLGAGFLFGVPVGTAAVSVGSTLGSTAAFLLGRSLVRDLVARRIQGHRRFAAIDAAVAGAGFKIVLLTRLSPIFPYNLQGYAYGLTRVRLRDYFLASWIGMLPGTVLYVYLGSGVRSISDLFGDRPVGVGQQVLFGAGLLATVVVTVLITRIARRAIREVVPAGREEP